MKIKENINKDIFREYDIRGEVGTQIDEDIAYTIGIAYGSYIKTLGRDKCIIAHDNRLSYKMLTNALVNGIYASGINITYLGLTTTPMFYYACIHLGIDAGIMVTASHNPVNDNGFKITFKDYKSACGKEIYDFYDYIIKGDFQKGEGSITKYDIKEDYVNKVVSSISLNKRLKVVVDPANAAGVCVVKDIFDRLNVDATIINNVSDGSFPNHHPDPSVKENMRELSSYVKKLNADVGIAYDGDADRVGFVDNLGNMINIDTFMAIMCDELIPKFDDKRVLFDVKCSKQLEDEIIKLGGIPCMYRTGASYIRNKIASDNILFGGELAGHVFFKDKWPGFDDGVYVGLRLLEVLSNKDVKLDELDDNMSKYYSTNEIKVGTREELKRSIVDKIKEYAISNNLDYVDIDGVKVKYPYGWALVRASNTGPNLTLRFEANTKEECDKLEKTYLDLVSVCNK